MVGWVESMWAIVCDIDIRPFWISEPLCGARVCNKD